MIEISADFWAQNGMGLMFLKTLAPLFALMIGFKILELVLEHYKDQKSVRFFLKKNRVEFFTLLFTIVGYLTAFFFVESPKTSLMVSIILTLIATTIIVSLKTRDRDFYFTSLSKGEHKEDWIGDGVFQFERTQQSYSITSSHSGFIFSKCLNWSDYRFDFDFKILDTSLGIIIRATNLSNLVMFQIFPYGIKAHIRVNGFWKAWEPSETDLLFSKKLCLDEWYGARFECDKRSVNMLIYDRRGKKIFDRSWKIPEGEMFFPYKPEGKNIGLIARSAIQSIPFPINLEYGTVGFRNDGKERALVRDVLVEKL